MFWIAFGIYALFGLSVALLISVCLINDLD